MHHQYFLKYTQKWKKKIKQVKTGMTHPISIWLIAKSKEIKADGRGLLRKLERVCCWAHASKQHMSSLSCPNHIVSQKWPGVKVLHRIVEMGNKVC